MTGPLHTLAVERHAALVVATLQGEVDSSNAEAVRDALVDLCAHTLVLDLSDVRYLDSAGMTVLDTVRRTTDLRLVVPPGTTIARSLDITGMTDLINTYPSVAAASS
jgi:anti-sigma B factor antagonist